MAGLPNAGVLAKLAPLADQLPPLVEALRRLANQPCGVCLAAVSHLQGTPAGRRIDPEFRDALERQYHLSLLTRTEAGEYLPNVAVTTVNGYACCTLHIRQAAEA